MKLKTIRVKHFKNIVNEQGVEINLNNGMTIVGPNNSGKTNIMEAIRMLFTGYDNKFGYISAEHLPFGSNKNRTSIVGTFSFEENDGDVKILLDDLNTMIGISNDVNEVQLYLQFSPTNKPIYQIHPNMKRPKQNSLNATYSKKLKDFTNLILNKFIVHYVPSYKSMHDIYADLLTPFLRKRVSKEITGHMVDINNALDETAQHISDVMNECGFNEYKVNFKIPDNSIEKLLDTFEFTLFDPNETSIFSKGMGIQSSSFLASFIWITEHEKSENNTILWLVEEPESYLHPSLYDNVNEILRRLARISNVVVTTHSISFVPKNPKQIIGTVIDDGLTKIISFKSFQEATESIRSSLGVKMSDFLNLGQYNVFLEGPTDREYIEKVFEMLEKHLVPEDIPAPVRKLIDIQDMMLLYELGGVSQLAGFLKANWKFIREERRIISIFDGDDAGKKAIRELQGYFGKKGIQFEANVDFITIPKGCAIEYMFPDSWIIELGKTKREWFDVLSLDFEHNLQVFKVKDSKKSSYMNYMLSKAKDEDDLDWALKWFSMFSMVSGRFKL